MDEKPRMKETVIDHDEENDVLKITVSPIGAGVAGITHRKGDFTFRYKRGALIGVTITSFSHYEEVIRLLIEHLTEEK